jgi:hypothetical protein
VRVNVWIWENALQALQAPDPLRRDVATGGGANFRNPALSGTGPPGHAQVFFFQDDNLAKYVVMLQKISVKR